MNFQRELMMGFKDINIYREYTKFNEYFKINIQSTLLHVPLNMRNHLIHEFS